MSVMVNSISLCSKHFQSNQIVLPAKRNSLTFHCCDIVSPFSFVRLKFVLVCAIGATMSAVQASDLGVAAGYGGDGNGVGAGGALGGNGYADGSSYGAGGHDVAQVSSGYGYGYGNNDYSNANYGYGSGSYQVQEVASNSIGQTHSNAASFQPSAADLTHESLNAGAQSVHSVQSVHGGGGGIQSSYGGGIQSSYGGGDIQTGYGGGDGDFQANYGGNVGYAQSNYEVAPAVHTHEQAIPISKHVEVTKSVPYPVYKQLHVPGN